MNEVEEKLVRSFRMVREDVIRLQRKILNMEQREAQIVRILKRIDVNEHDLSEKIRKLNSLFKKPNQYSGYISTTMTSPKKTRKK